MKNYLLLLVLLTAGCSKSTETKISLALSARHGGSINIISFYPAYSNTPDSIEYAAAYRDYRLHSGMAFDYLNAGANPDTMWIGDSLKAANSRYKAAYNKFTLSSSIPGFFLCRYVVSISSNSEKSIDTLTAVLDPSFRVVWPH